MWSCRWAVLNLARPTSYRGAARLNLTKSPRNYCSSVESANHQPLKGMEQPFLYGSFRLPVTPWQLGVRTGCWLCRESWVELLRRILGGRTAEVMTRSRAPKRIKGKHNNLTHVYIYIYSHICIYIYISYMHPLRKWSHDIPKQHHVEVVRKYVNVIRSPLYMSLSTDSPSNKTFLPAFILSTWSKGIGMHVSIFAILIHTINYSHTIDCSLYRTIVVKTWYKRKTKIT